MAANLDVRSPPGRADLPGAAGTAAAEVVAALRDTFARLREAVATHCEPAGRGPCPAPVVCTGYAPIQQALDGVTASEKRLLSLADRAVAETDLVAQLVGAAQGIAAIEKPEALVDAIPELGLLVCRAAAAALLRIASDGSVHVLARCGAFETPQGRVDEESRMALREGTRFCGECACTCEPRAEPGARAGRLVTIPLPRHGERLVLALERASSSACFHEPELEHLVVFASIAATALARAHAVVELREAAAQDAAILAAIRDGVIAVDHDGVVRAVNQAATAALGVRKDELLARPLRSVPGLAPLADALGRTPSDTLEVVSLARGDVVLRAQLHEGGVVATIRDVATEHTIAQRIVGSVARYTFDDLIGRSPALLRVVEDAKRAARSDVPILVCGESGTGKELLAQAIHNASPGASAPFIGINVTAIPRELLESELFGYEGGTFTGARAAGRAGKFELAGRGTLLLDEIGDMPLEMQGKLLRVLQERILQRLGSARDVPVRARIIATSHRNLLDLVGAGRFRLDLYHRLCVLHLVLPPLRGRREDVPLLIEHQLQRHAQRTGRRVRISRATLAALEAYDWPGNVRQLVNVLEGELSVLRPDEQELSRVPPALREGQSRPIPPAAGSEELLPLEEVERRACERTLAACKGNVARAAHALGVAKGTLYSKMKRYGIGPPEAALACAQPPGADAPAPPRRDGPT